jgi:hypothetical protein
MIEPSQESTDALMAVLTNLIAAANTPEMQQAQVLLLQRLALEGSVIPSRIAAPADITQIGGYINLLTTLGQDDMRTQMLGAALGLAGSVPLPGLGQPGPPLTLTSTANDRPPGETGTGVAPTVSMRSDLVAGLSRALDAAHTAGGLLPLWTPSALPPAGASVLQDLLLYLGRAVLVAPTTTMVDPQTDPVVLGRPDSDGGTGFRLALRVNPDVPGSDNEDWTCLAREAVDQGFVTQTVSGASMLPMETVLAGSGLTASRSAAPPTGRDDLSWARLAALGGLIPSVTRLGDELALVQPAARIRASALATMTDWMWNGSRFAPAS